MFTIILRENKYVNKSECYYFILIKVCMLCIHIFIQSALFLIYTTRKVKGFDEKKLNKSDF